MLYNIPCIIFAGGKSSRMGEDKALLPFSIFKTLTEFQYSRLKKIFKNVYISCKDKSKFNFEANFIEDKDAVYAPTTAFVSIFHELKEEKFFVLSVDTPFIDTSIIEKVIESDKNNYDATITKLNQKMQPLIGIYHRSLQKEFEAMLSNDNHKLGKLLQKVNTHYISFENEKSFLNLNHPEEYQKALTLI